MSRRLVIGIDPGADGAVAALYMGRPMQILGAARLARWVPRPQATGDAAAMTAALRLHRDAVAMLRAVGVEAGDTASVIMEAPQLRPRQSGGAVQGVRAGAVGMAGAMAIYTITGRPPLQVEAVTAAEWTRAMGLQVSSLDAASPAAERAARKRHRCQRVMELAPGAGSMLIQDGCRVAHDGVADAILIALYGAGYGDGQ